MFNIVDIPLLDRLAEERSLGGEGLPGSLKKSLVGIQGEVEAEDLTRWQVPQEWKKKFVDEGMACLASLEPAGLVSRMGLDGILGLRPRQFTREVISQAGTKKHLTSPEG